MANKYSRQILAFGPQGQIAIQAQRASIVGLGGMGSQIAQALAYLGVVNFTLIDEDLVEDSNLNRLIGATPAHAEQKAPKVLMVERMIRSINPDVQSVVIVKNDMRRENALKALISSTIIFGCVDHDTPRLILTELSCAYRIPFIDSASDIILNEDRTQLVDFGGRVIVSVPGEFCLFCANEIDTKAAKAGLETKEVQALREKHGYGLGKEFPDPSVVSLNGIIANVAVTEFLAMITGIRKPFKKRVYQGMRGVILNNTDSKRLDCYNCGFLLGQGDRANIFRYALPNGKEVNTDGN